MILLDTHVLIWALMEPSLLSQTARAAIDEAPAWSISSASLYEIRYKASIGKWPDVEPIAKEGLQGTLEDLGITIRPATGAIMDLAGGVQWEHRDPFDRIIIATSVLENVALVSKDATLDSHPDEGFRRVW
ncbi:MAG: type II toxin-antitoxin system VapC family toxin [Pseudomonadota bacterium]